VICALRIEYVVPLLAPLLSTVERKKIVSIVLFLTPRCVCSKE
jgi:hypothetical protein